MRELLRIREPLVLAVFAGLPGSAAADILYVDKDATGANDGSSWADAYTALDVALKEADFGDQIWVTGDKYFPGRLTNIDDPTYTTSDPRDATFWIPRGVQVYGGFLGTESAVSQRPFPLTQTILSGDIGVPGDDSDNSYRVVYYRAHHGGGYGASDSDQSISAVLDGFKVSGANADMAAGAGVYGRGVFIGSTLYNANFYIANCIISNNTSVGNGGGMLLTNWTGDIDSSEISSNHSDAAGGGLSLSQPAGERFITNTVFSDNSAGGDGGAIARQGDTPFTACAFQLPTRMINCTFVDNSADSNGGAIRYSSTGCQNASLDLTNCEFAGNSALGTGGAVYLGHGSVISQSPLAYINGAKGDFQNCTFADNSATTSGGGVVAGVGSITQTDADVTIANSILWGNSAPSDAQANAIIAMFASCVDGGGWSTLLGNISSDPLFYDAASGDYSLNNGSPAADAGWNPYVSADHADIDGDSDTSENLPLDLAFKSRIVDAGAPDTGVGPGSIVDMGAYELCSGDYDRNGTLDFFDVSAFLVDHGAGNLNADIDGNGVVDAADVTAFLAAHSAGC